MGIFAIALITLVFLLPEKNMHIFVYLKNENYFEKVTTLNK